MKVLYDIIYVVTVFPRRLALYLRHGGLALYIVESFINVDFNVDVVFTR